MKNLNIKYIKAKNFLCFGEKEIELNFSKLGNMILVKGLNLDVLDIESNVSSNGAGKSSIPEIIVYTLFGKTIKHPKKISHKDVINNSIGKGLVTEIQWDKYRVVRTRKPDSLRLWESSEAKWNESTEITLGGQPATQKLIEEKIGLNYETFTNVVIFTDNNSGSFLECDASGKREIVENLLSLEKYKGFADTAKNLKKEKKDIIKIIQVELEGLIKQKDQSDSRIKLTKEQENNWRNKIIKEIRQIKENINNISIESSGYDKKLEEYNNAILKIEDLKEDLKNNEDKRSKVEAITEKAEEKFNQEKSNYNDIKSELKNIDYEIKKLKEDVESKNNKIKELNEIEGKHCDYCYGVISKENSLNYFNNVKLDIEKSNEKIYLLDDEKNKILVKIKYSEDKLKEINKAVSSAKEIISKTSNFIREMRGNLSALQNINKPTSDNSIIEQKINILTDQLNEKSKETSPFLEITSSLEEEMKIKENEISEKYKILEENEKELPYFDFWQIGFGDSGIRKFVIDGIIPALNSRIAHWMQYLIDGKISLKFNNELEETIERNPSDGDPFVYHAMSGGERRRLNLAVSQAFAHVMMLNSGMQPSLVFLDEVTTNIDQIGVVGVYNMISQLAKDRQIFITTHDQNLLEMLEGCELITLERKNGFTNLKK